MADVAITHGEAHGADHPETTTGLPHTKLAMWIFLASECMLFGALITTYVLYRGRPGQPPPHPHEIFDIPYTSVSSFVLLSSSVTMVLALASAQKRDMGRMRLWLLATAMLGLTFVGGQVYEFTTFYHVGMSMGDRLPDEPAFPVEMVGLYWHFVDIVWIVIFTIVYLIPTGAPQR